MLNRIFKYCFISFIAAFILQACQNEVGFDLDIPAEGTLKTDSTGDCFPSVVAGNYVQDSMLNNTNYIDVQVYVTTTGIYNIRTDSVNGYYFHGSGIIDSTGLNTVRLFGSGKPLFAQTNIFQVKFGSSVCAISVTVSGTSSQASFTLGNTGGNCTGALLSGTYTSAVAMTTSNTVTLNISVTDSGSYSITTPTVNGVYFSGAGSIGLSSTSIVLTAQGTPTASSTVITSNYTVINGTDSCTFSVVYAASPVGPASFTFDCATLNGVIYGLTRVGTPVDPLVNADTVMVDVITVGTYSVSSVVSLGSADGVSFNTTGTFTTTGVQPLILSAHGTPTRPGFVFYNISSPQATNTTLCSTGAYYDFLLASLGTSFRNFTFSSLTTFDNTTMAGFDLVRMKGLAAVGSTESLELIIGLPTGGSFNNTTSTDVVYSTNDLPVKYVKATYRNAANPQVDYIAESGVTNAGSPFKINISFCTGGRIEGSFNGILKDGNGTGSDSTTVAGTFGLVR